MRLLAIDPGAERCGWALMEPGPVLLDSGVLRCQRGTDEDFQHYRLRLEKQAYWFFDELLSKHIVSTTVNEIIPAVGGGNFIVATQSYLANCVVTTLHIAAYGRGCEVHQLSARTVQARIAKRGRSKGVTKAQVRNGVIEIMPEVGLQLTSHLLEWDRWDAIANGLCYLGHSLPVTKAK